jgi:hypothetical protein
MKNFQHFAGKVLGKVFLNDGNFAQIFIAMENRKRKFYVKWKSHKINSGIS